MTTRKANAKTLNVMDAMFRTRFAMFKTKSLRRREESD
jgi:hypothetical protein